MRKVIKIMMMACALAMLTACTNPNMQTAESIPDFPDASGPQESGMAEKTDMQWKSVRWLESRTDSGGTDLICLAEIVNTGEEPIAIQQLNLTLLAADGEILKTAENVKVYPAVLKAGQTGYVAERVVNSLNDRDFTVEEVEKIEPEGDFWELKPKDVKEEPDIVITDAALDTTLDTPNLTCNVTNNEDEEWSAFAVSCPVFSKDGVLLAVITASAPEPLKPGETVELKQMAVNFDEQADYTAAAFETFLNY